MCIHFIFDFNNSVFTFLLIINEIIKCFNQFLGSSKVEGTPDIIFHILPTVLVILLSLIFFNFSFDSKQIRFDIKFKFLITIHIFSYCINPF